MGGPAGSFGGLGNDMLKLNLLKQDGVKNEEDRDTFL